MALVLLSSLAAEGEPTSATEAVAGIENYDHVLLSADLAVYPAPDGWIKDSSVVVSVRLLNQSSEPLLSTVSLKLDGLSLGIGWAPEDREISSESSVSLLDGPHVVNVSFRDGTGQMVSADWSFSVDTRPPVVHLDLLPDMADARLFWVRGRVVEENLLEVRVNSFAAILEDGLFRVPVLLWPGRNQVEAVALDLAGNRGLGLSETQWFPNPPANESYEPILHVNSSFIIRIPSSWTVQRDFELEGGVIADVLAHPSETKSSVSPSVVVLSQPVGEVLSEGLFLGVMESAIRNLAARAEVQVVSRSRLIESGSNTLAAEASILEARDLGPRVFVSVTGFWNGRVHRIWLVIGSLPADRVEVEWHAIQVASETFSVIEPAPPTEGPLGPPDVSASRALLVTVGAIVFVFMVFVMALYSRRLRSRGHQRQR